MKPTFNLGGAAPGWAALAIIASLLLPWYGLPDDFAWLRDYHTVFSAQAAANGWVQASDYQRPWLFLPLAAPLLAVFALMCERRRNQGLLLAFGAGIGVVGQLGAGFAIGIQGWVWSGLQAGALGLPAGQYGFGWGAAIVLLALLMLLAIGLARLGL
ncbi:MAG: iron ABC transporter permease, partial [Massilia sp.]